MAWLPRVTPDQFVRALRREGWALERPAFSHARYAHRTKPGQVTLAMHKGQTIHRGPVFVRARMGWITIHVEQTFYVTVRVGRGDGLPRRLVRSSRSGG